VLSSVALGCSADAADDAGGSQNAIVGGTVDDKDAAVVAINIESTGFAVCSGTLIAPDVVLTAGHCPLEHIWVRQGTSVRNVGWTSHTSVRAAVKHPGFTGEGKHYDVALIQLDEPLKDVTPLPLSDTPLSDADIGSVVRHIGFGTTGDDWNYVKKIATGGLKRQASFPITKIDDFFLWSGAPGKQTCIFDSGGPTLLTKDGVERLIGVVSAGPDCTQDGYDTRIDRDDILSWIDQQLEQWGAQRLPSPK
jgi:V8-like Glu-specific endopeptidase